jgi:restriction system protein
MTVPEPDRTSATAAPRVGVLGILARALVLFGLWRLADGVHRAGLWGPVAFAFGLAGALLLAGVGLRRAVARAIERARHGGASLTQLDGMSGAAFEDWVVRALARGGFRCENLPRSHDYGIDVIATRGGRRLGVQAKRHQGPVGNGAVQQAIAGAGHHACDLAVVVTQSRFTAAARVQAGSATPPVVLVDRDGLAQLGRRLRRFRPRPLRRAGP